MTKMRLFVIILGLSFASDIIFAQDVETMLNVIAEVFNTRQEALYDEAENYLKALSKDSIERNLETEILYHGNMAFLYSLKYSDSEKASNELGYILNKITPVKHLPEFNDSYKNILRAYAFFLLNSGQTENALSYFNKILVEDFDDEFDSRIFDAYHALADIYAEKKEIVLSEDCHNKCQEFLIKSYIRNHPEYSFYQDNYNTYKYQIFQQEKKNETNTEEYINNLCFLGHLLNKVDEGEYWESMLVLQKAFKCARDNDLLKAKGLELCFVSLQDIYIKYLSEPIRTQAVEGLVPYMIDFYSGILTPEDIYEDIALSYGANEQYEKAIEYELKVLNSFEKKPDKNRLQIVYKDLVDYYLECSSDSANQIAYQYLKKFRVLISEKDQEYYEWYLVNNGIILRYLYKNDEAIQCFKKNLSYFNKTYGKESDEYVSTLNQLAMCYPFESGTCLSYLLQAKSLITNSKDVKESTIRGVCVNLARNYIITGKIEQAKIELNKAAAIEKKTFGEILPVTMDLILQCGKQ